MTAGASDWSRACIVGMGLMLVLTAIPAPAQAGPCVKTGEDGVSLAECAEFRYLAPGGGGGGGGGGDSTPSSSAFSGVNATAVTEDVRVTWSFDRTMVEANVTTFHVERGINPHWSSSMRDAGTTGPNASAFVDDDALLDGALWYQVTAELDDGATVESEPVHLTGAYVDET